MKKLELTLAALMAAFVGATATNAQAQTPINWGDNAIPFRGQNGAQLRFACPAGGGAQTVWGTDIYTDDSSICTAAVHAGAIGWNGGLVTIQILPGRGGYSASSRNGVTTSSYGAWTGSFAVIAGQAAGPAIDPAAWSRNAEGFNGQAGPITHVCPAGGTPNPVWGTDYYSSDSSICTAAVHAGVITLGGGGRVTFYMHGGMSSYTASSRNGIDTRSWGAWGSTFAFTPNPPMNVRAIDWGTDGASVVSTGTTAVVFCPGGGSAGSVWGTDVYSSDSSICTAAVHAGVIGWNGGAVLVTGVPGQASYRASLRNGVATSSWGSYGSSFVVAAPR